MYNKRIHKQQEHVMQVTNDTHVSENEVQFTFSDGSQVVLQEVRPDCDKPYFSNTGKATAEQAEAISDWSNLAVV
jgi:ribosomal protein S4E